MKENVIEIKAFEFAKKIVSVYKYLTTNKNEYIMSKQLLRSGTSIGANVYEAERGVSKRDFANKMAIALKEANETAYWIELLYQTEYIHDKNYDEIKTQCKELVSILVSIVKSSMSTDDESALF